MRFFGFQWHITDRCNLRCAHCYQDIFSKEREKDVGVLKRFADKIFGSGLAKKISVNITGGEPLLYPYLGELLTHINSFSSCDEINIITNGTYIDDKLVSILTSLENLRYIKISIESPDAEVNNRIRGNNNLKTVSANLEKFRSAGKDILIMMTLASYNFNEIEEMVRFVKENSLSGIIFERFVPLGNGRGLREAVLNSSQWRMVVENILRLANLDLSSQDLAQYRGFWLENKRRKLYLKAARCNLGRGSMALMPDGSIYPCRRYNKKIADINQQSFKEILSILSQYEIKNIKKRLNGNLCSLCGFGGCAGCRALVYAVLGDESGDDFQCFLSAK